MRKQPPNPGTVAGRLRLSLEALCEIEARDVTITELADRCGQDRQRFGHYFTGARRPPLSMIVKIAEALGVSAGYIAFGEKDSLRPDEQQLVTAYRASPPERRQAIRTLLPSHNENR